MEWRIYGLAGSYRDYRGYIGIMGCMLGLYGDNGKENGNYYIVYWDYIGVILGYYRVT